jgi:hypothetical protein
LFELTSALAHPLASCSQAVFSLLAPLLTRSTGTSWYPSSGAVSTVPLASVSFCAPTGGYSPCRNPNAEFCSTVSRGADTVSCPLLTTVDASPAMWLGEAAST